MEQVSFKVSLIKKDQEESPKSQVRRFEVPQDCSTSYIYLKEKLRSLFGQELGNSGVNITWKDQENDTITIESDDELLIAIQEMKGPVYKFCIFPSKVSSENEQERHHKVGELHPGIICDGCEGQVYGFRYKCMTCFDYDLCETCEIKGIHPGHNMMRIATPESVWPGHFINRLNKMQNSYRAFKSNEESRNSCRWPRGSGCSRDSGRFHNRGAGIKRGGCRIPPFWISNQQYCNTANSEESNSKRCKRDQTFGEVLKATEEAVRAALESTHLNAKDSKESDSKKESVNPSEAPKSPMNHPLNVGQIMKATEQAVRATFESNNLNSKDVKDSDSKKDSSRTPNNSASTNAMNDFNNFGEIMMGVLSSLGIELNAEMKNSKDSENKENPEGPNKATQEQGNNSETSESGTKPNNRIYPTLEENSEEQEKDSEMPETGTKPKTRSIPIIEENRQTDENSFEVLSNPETDSTQKKDAPEAMEETVMPLSPKVKVALQAMENMGFNNDNNWLSDLLMKYDGDIGKVLDLIRANQIRSN